MSRAERANDEAAKFIIAKEDGPWLDTDQEELDSWLAKADGNKAAYWRLAYSWREADRITALRSAGPRASRSAGASTLRFWAAGALAATFIAVLGINNLVLPLTAEKSVITYTTPVGGSKIVDLSDGSRIQLNTASKARAAVTAKRREFWIDKGEAYFEVTHIEGKPFLVNVGDRRVTVLGTKFSVRKDDDKVTVSVLEGRVRVEEVGYGNAHRSAVISAGDIALGRHGLTLVTTRSQRRVQNALTWRSGTLSFDQTNLVDVVSEFNRYNRKQIIVTDEATKRIRVGGMFPSSQPDAFVRLLRDAYGLNVTETNDVIKISN